VDRYGNFVEKWIQFYKFEWHMAFSCSHVYLTVKLISSWLSVKPLYLPNDTAQHCTRLELSATPMEELHISFHYFHLFHMVWRTHHTSSKYVYGAEM
jgi:hypothetical protein